MIVDDQTLRDLEVFRTQGHDPPLFDVLDRTRTRGGREKLRSRFKAPFSTATRIRDVQESLRFLCEFRQCFNAIPTDSELLTLERYLHLDLELIRSSDRFDVFVEAMIIRFGYRDLYLEAFAGLALCREVMGKLSGLLANEALRDAPGDVGQVIAEIDTALAALEAAGVLRPMPYRRFASVLRTDNQVRGKIRPEIERVVQLVYELDALIAMADCVRDGGLTFPVVVDGPTQLDGRGIVHPLLRNPVPNDLQADAETRVLLITGPNMAGKSTYLRSCATALYLAHLGMGVPARAFTFTPFDLLITGITVTDNLRGGLSLFRAETLRIKQVATAVAEGMRVFAVLDEPFKGTNVKDALDASRSVLTSFAAAAGNVFLVASHLFELADYLEPGGAAAFYKLEAREHNGSLEFDYRLKPGASSQRLGMRVLADEGVTALLQQLSGRGV